MECAGNQGVGRWNAKAQMEADSERGGMRGNSLAN